MSKKILLVRHAKSDWGYAGLSDFNRPLNPRGLKDSSDMAQRIKMQNLIPDKIVSSPAVRALTTSRLMCENWGETIDSIVTESKIYEANVKDLLGIVNDFDDDDDYVALFGHNNAITDFVVYLTDEDLFNIPTCGMALIEFPFDNWELVSKQTGDMLMYDFPKNEA